MLGCQRPCYHEHTHIKGGPLHDAGARGQVASVAKKEAARNPVPPFTTSTMQQDAHNRLGFSPSATMQLAQQLYEGPEAAGGSLLLTDHIAAGGAHRVCAPCCTQCLIGQSQYVRTECLPHLCDSAVNAYNPLRLNWCVDLLGKM